MSDELYFENPDYLTYIRLLSDLHALIREGRDELPEGDAIREQMGEPGSRLSRDEIAGVNGVSADFYSLSDPPSAALPQTAEANAGLRRAVDCRDAGDLHSALVLVREYSAFVPPAVLAYLRGTIWMELGEHPIAHQYFQHAAMIDPDNQNYAYLMLTEFAQIDYDSALNLSRQITAEPNLHHAKIVLKAIELLFYSANNQAEDESRSLRESLIPVFEETIFRMETAGETGSQLAMAFALAGFCHESLNDFGAALQYYDRGLSLSPNHDALLVARGILQYGRDTRKAVQDFAKAIQNGSRLVWPYFFMAHHSLVQDLYEDCLRYCGLSERFATTTSVLANVLEWAAISHASLGSPRSLVEAIFQAAQNFGPGNDRISRNFQIFKDSLQRLSLATPMRWEKGDEGAVQRFAESEFRLAA